MDTYRHIVLFSALVFTCLDAANAQAIRTNDRRVLSTKVSLGHGDYTVVSKGGRDLFLQHSEGDSIREWRIRYRDVLSKSQHFAQLQPLEKRKSAITNLSLARWSSNSLLLVVKEVDGDRSLFWCLGLTKLDPSMALENELSGNAKFLMDGDQRDRVIALSGDLQPPAIAIIVGKQSESKPNEFESGVIAFEWCGDLDVLRAGQFIPRYSGSEPSNN